MNCCHIGSGFFRISQHFWGKIVLTLPDEWLYRRPGATEINVEEEIARVVPIIEGIRAAAASIEIGRDITISIDTRRAAVVEAAVAAGADVVNDVSGGRFDPAMLATVEKAGVPLIMMHMRYARGSQHTLTILQASYRPLSEGSQQYSHSPLCIDSAL